MVESAAVDRAVVECIEQNGELAQILLEHRSEVVNMLLAEFDEEAFIRDIHAEGLAEGLEKGIGERVKVFNCHFTKIYKFFATLSSDEFTLFDFSYTESCRCSINVLN